MIDDLSTINFHKLRKIIINKSQQIVLNAFGNLFAYWYLNVLRAANIYRGLYDAVWDVYWISETYLGWNEISRHCFRGSLISPFWSLTVNFFCFSRNRKVPVIFGCGFASFLRANFANTHFKWFRLFYRRNWIYFGQLSGKFVLKLDVVFKAFSETKY